MPQHNLLSTKVVLKESVKQGQAVSLTGELANTSNKSPAGITMYDGNAGDTIAICLAGFMDVPINFPAYVGLGLDVENGNFKPTQGNATGFATITAVNGKNAEVVVGVQIRSQVVEPPESDLA